VRLLLQNSAIAALLNFLVFRVSSLEAQLASAEELHPRGDYAKRKRRRAESFAMTITVVAIGFRLA